jgi:transposase
MLTNLLLPWLAAFRLDTITTTDTRIDLELTATQAEARCPLCGQGSRAIHSHYDRTIADLPWANTPVRLSIHVRKFFCRNAACARTVFTERLPALAAPSARRTQRLATEQGQLALDHGGEAAVRTATRQGMPLSARTVLRLARRMPAFGHPTPKILGVDDFAFRKGQTYGTLLVDLERHQPIDMLGDRSADTLATWLEQHPGVEIITRDRAPEYANGATRGAPQAIQVADRFHLASNLRETLQRLLERHQAALRNAAVTPPVEPEPPATPGVAVPSVSASTTDTPLTEPRTRQERDRQRRRSRRLDRYAQIRALHDQGHGIRAIARQLDVSRQTVRRSVRADQFPEQGDRPARPSTLDPHITYLHQQLAAGNDNALALWRDLRDHHGYTGSRTTVSSWVAQQRQHYPANRTRCARRSGRPPTAAGASPRPARMLSARQASWLLVRRPDELEPDDRAIVERLCQLSPDIQIAYPLAQEFRRIVRERHSDALTGWIGRAEASGLAELQSFAAGIRRDQAAVSAALALPFSNERVAYCTSSL